MSFRYVSGINKPGFNPLAAQTTTYLPYLYSWGANGSGQLGLGNTTAYSSPKQVGSLTTWVDVVAGPRFVMATKESQLWSWGYNASGQLGLNDQIVKSSPNQVGALANWLLVAAGNYHTIATKTDGTMWAWGENSLVN